MKQPLTLSQFAEEIACRARVPAEGEKVDPASKNSGFVALIGAGLSAASGIPVGPALHEYLKGCVYLALEETVRWDPRTCKWPPVHRMWTQKKPEWFRDSLHDPLREEEEAASRKWGEVGQRAIGALASWEEALDFLTRVHWRKDELRLGPSDGRVRDSLFAHLTGGKRPNSGHEMLAHLLGPLRIRTLLTTNFDNLVEESLERLRSPVAVYDVHRHASLPPAELVLAQPSIVKLHGGKYGLRADDSLADQPSAEDKEIFASYFSGEPGSPKKDLLVLGVSGRDPRILDLIEYLCEKHCVGTVFWASYSQKEIDALKDLAGKLEGEQEYPRLVRARHHDAGLLLLEIYQRACLALPPMSTGSQAFWEVPAEPYPALRRDQTLFDGYKTSLLKMIDKALDEEKKSPLAELSRIIAVDGRDGVASVAAEVYDDLCDRSICCVWMGMSNFHCKEDSFSAKESFFSALAQAIARRTGVSYVAPLNLGDDSDFTREMTYYLQRSRLPVVVFLNGADGYGTAAGERGDSWSDDHRKEFYEFLHEVSQPKLFFVLLFRPPQDKDKACGTFLPKPLPPGWRSLVQEEKCLNFDTEKVKQEVEGWLKAGDSEAQRRFVYSLTLFRHSRYLAALCSRAQESSQPPHGPPEVGDDQDLRRYQEATQWLQTLEEKGAIRMKPGGLVWMHEEQRRALEELLEKSFDQLKSAWSCHQSIADWYAKLFRSLHDPLAALESVYHRIRCADRATLGRDRDGKPLAPDLVARIRETALIEALAMLRLAQGRMLACGLFETCETFVGILRGMAEALAKDAEHEQSGLRTRAEELRVACDRLLRDLANEESKYDEALRISKELKTGKQPEDTGHGHGSNECPPNRGEDPEARKLRLSAEDSEASFLTGLRAYQPAEDKLLAIIQHSIADEFRQLVDEVLKNKSPVLRDAQSKVRAYPLDSSSSDQEMLKLTVTALRRLVFLRLLAAEAERFPFAWGQPGGPGQGLGEEAERGLKQAAALYAMCTEVMRSVEDEDFLQLENVYLRMHYGSVLSSLQRFSEAHRRLNEATGYLRCLARNSDRLSWGLIDLRRVEVYLARAEAESASPATAALPLLDSAHIALQQARRRLEGRSREVSWWTWMYELELGICELTSRLNLCDSQYAPQICRLCSFRREGGRLAQIVHAEQRLIRSDVLRQARIVDLLSRFKSNRETATSESRNDEFRPDTINELIEEAKESLAEVRRARDAITDYPLNGRIGVFADAVLKAP